MAAQGERHAPAINALDCATKSMLDNFNGCRHSLPDGILHASDARLGGNRALLRDYGDAGQGCADAML
eukprot:10061512-Lingulodinium_polyedra.AAC.1